MKGLFNSLKIRSKFLLFHLFLAIIALSVITGATLGLTRVSSEKDSILMINDILEQVGQNIYNRMEEINSLMLRMYGNTDVLTIIGRDEPTVYQQDMDYARLHKLLQEISQSYKNIYIQIIDLERNVEGLSGNYNTFSSNKFSTMMDLNKLRQDPVYTKLFEDTSKGFILKNLDRETWPSSPLFFSIMKVIHRAKIFTAEMASVNKFEFDTDSPIGIMFIFLNKDDIKNIYKSSELTRYGTVYLTTEEGELLSTSDRTIDEKNYRSPLDIKKLKEIEKNRSDYSWITLEEKSYLCSVRKISFYNFYLYTLQPKKSVLRNYYTLRNVVYIITVIILITVTGAEFLLASSLSKPIEYLTSKMNYYIKAINEKPDLMTLSVDEDITRSLLKRIKTNDEIGSLANTFSLMLHNIKQMNTALIEKERIKHEMDTAKEIQLTSLPCILNEPNYEMSARMIPADEVGGDFYDYYVEADGRALHIIGDVSGHGLNAGLIMFMVQSSVRTLILSNPGIEINKIVTELNTFLYKNIVEVMKIEEFVTFLVTEGYPDGHFALAGFHLFPLLYKSASRKCEEIEVEGIYLGMLESVDHLIKKKNFIMEKGDILVLYTDGIVEARNRKSRLYDTERLIQIITTHSDQSTEEISDAVIEDVMDYMDVQKDDITLFLIKKV